MSKIHLTDLTVQRLGPGTYMDERTPGFGIRVNKTRKTWLATNSLSQFNWLDDGGVEGQSGQAGFGE